MAIEILYFVTPIIPQAPYKDVAAAIPGKIEVENYDVGGSGKAYLDKDDDNKGGEYREDAVDIVKADEGYAIGYTQEGEWLEYTVNVDSAMDYDLSIRYATSSENTGVKLYVDDQLALDGVSFPQGADWETYAVFDAGKVNLAAGEHVLKLEIVGNYVNIDWLSFADPAASIMNVSAGLRLSPKSCEYHVFDMQGRLMATLTATDAESLEQRVSAAVKRSGTYLVKSRTGATFRIQVR